jgi:iron complex outermembrane receptor protein
MPLIEHVSTQNYPVNFKMRSSARWQRGSVDVSTTVNFANGYRDTFSRRHVDSWTTIDLHAAYTFNRAKPDWAGDTTLSVGIDNLLDKNPPFLNNSVGIGYDQENGDLIGRMLSLTVRKTW